MAKITAAELSARLADHIEKLAEFLIATAPTSKDKQALRWGNRGSFCVFIAGERRGRFFDHELGQGGDALDLICRMQRCTIGQGMRWACNWLNIDPDHDLQQPAPVAVKPQKPAADDDVKRRTEMARLIWLNSVPPIGTLVEKYLTSRGLLLPGSDVLRFHPQCPCGTDRLPAMVALMTDPVTGDPTGVHRTFLAADGSGKAPIEKSRQKLMLGPAGIIRLSADEDVCLGLGLAEGIETALSVLQIAHWRPMWAAGNSGAISKFPVLPGIEALTVFADADPAGMKAAHTCCERWTAAEREARIIRPNAGSDFNDVADRCAA